MFNQFAKYEDTFRDWRRDGIPGLKAESCKYVEFLTSLNDDQVARPGTLWPHQWESFRRVDTTAKPGRAAASQAWRRPLLSGRSKVRYRDGARC